MRAIEAEINQRRAEPDRRTDIKLTNFRGIELRDFPAEIARLALIIAEYQCDVLYRGQKEALAEFLPLEAQNWITCGNALRLDWLSICPPTGKSVKFHADDLFGIPLDQAEIDFENEGGETYICGNPPYVGDKKQDKSQKRDLEELFGPFTGNWKSLDYVTGWLIKAALYGEKTNCISAFVTTNSVCQGQQVPVLWPIILGLGYRITFAHTSFKWSNLATQNAGVTVTIIAISNNNSVLSQLYALDESGVTVRKVIPNINPYLLSGESKIVAIEKKPLADLPEMLLGNFPKDGGHLIVNNIEREQLDEVERSFLRPMFGGHEFIQGRYRYCFWITAQDLEAANKSEKMRARFEKVRENRLKSTKSATVAWAEKPYRFVEVRSPDYKSAIIVPRVSSEERQYLPVGQLPNKSIITEAFALYDTPIWVLSLLASKLHVLWIKTICGQLETRLRYSNTLGWNTFPVPTLTEQNKADLTRCAEDILLAREQYFPATIADMYDPDRMDTEFPLVRAAHERNDEVLERIYIGRRFKNDTERLEKLFDLYTKMTASDVGKAQNAKMKGSK